MVMNPMVQSVKKSPTKQIQVFLGGVYRYVTIMHLNPLIRLIPIRLQLTKFHCQVFLLCQVTLRSVHRPNMPALVNNKPLDVRTYVQQVIKW